MARLRWQLPLGLSVPSGALPGYQASRSCQTPQFCDNGVNLKGLPWWWLRGLSRTTWAHGI